MPLRGYDLASRRPIGEVRLTHRLFEDPTRIAGVRGYQHGDPLNRIHWRATARTGALHCKIYEPSCIAGVTLLLDFHKEVYTARREPHRSELANHGAASLANAVYQMGQQIGLVTNGRDAADRIQQEGYRHEFRTRSLALDTAKMREHSDRLRPVIVETRRGPEQLVRILEALARLELTEGLTFPPTGDRSDQPLAARCHASSPSSPAVPAEAAIALGSLKRRGYAVTAILVTYDDDDDAPGQYGTTDRGGNRRAAGRQRGGDRECLRGRSRALRG